MPIFNVRAPDGSLMKINGPEDATDEELIQIAEQNYKPEPTLGQRAKAAWKQGLEQIPESIEGLKLGTEAGLDFTNAAQQKLAEIKKKQNQPQAIQQITFQDLEDAYGKEGALAALKKLPSYVSEQILQNAPSMAAPLAAGAAATPFVGPIGGAIAGIGTYGLQQAGQFMQRQAQEAQDISQLNPAKAFTAAAVTAPLGYFMDRLTLGLANVPEKVIGNEIMAELAKRTGASVAGRTATGATIGVLAESPTEVLEQMAERWQAGLPLFDDKAKSEYKEAAAGAAVLGGIGGGVSHAMQAPSAPAVRPEDLTKTTVAPPQTMATLPSSEPPGAQEEPQGQQPLLQLGYSPLPGVLPVTEQGQVALTPEDLLAQRYKPQPTEAEIQRQAREQAREEEAQAIKESLDQKLAIRQAERQDRLGKQKKGTVGPWSAEEKEAMGIPVAEKQAQQYKAVEHPENKGFVLDEQGNPQLADLAQGGQKFKNKAQADEMKGNLADYKSIAMPGGGFALSPKSDAELAKEGASKLRFANVSAPGMPMAVHEMIASEGGLNADAAKNANVSQQRVGNRYLVAGKGKGVTADRVREMLESNGYVQPDQINDNEALQMVADSIKKPIYTPDGYEQIASLEKEKATKEAEKADLAERLKSPLAEEMGYPSFEATPEEAHDALSRVKEAGFDPDLIMEQAHEDTKNGTDQDFHRRIVDISNHVLGTVGERGPVGEAPTMETIRESRNPDIGINNLNAADFVGAKNGKDLLQKYTKVAKDSGLKDLANLFLQSNRVPDIGVNFIKSGDKVENPNVVNSLNNGALAVSATGEEGSQVYYRSDNPDAFNEDTLVHEVLHSMTEGALARNPTLRKELVGITGDITKGLREMRAMATNPEEKARLKELLDFWTGAIKQNPGEMLAYSLTSPTFRDVFSKFAADGRPFSGYRTQAEIDALRVRKEKPSRLGERPEAPKGPSMWQRIVDFARRLIGLPAKYQKQFEEALIKHQDALKQHEEALTQNQREEREHRTMAPLKQRLEGHLKRLLADTEEKGVALKGEAVQEAKAIPQRTQLGNDAMDLVHSMVRQVAAPSKAVGSSLLKGKKSVPTMTEEGHKMMALLESIGRDPKPGAGTVVDQAKAAYKQAQENYKENPTKFKEEAKERVYGRARKFEHFIGNKVFTSSFALRSELDKYFMGQDISTKQKIGTMLEYGTAQADNANSVANAALLMGKSTYNNDLKKWMAEEDENNAQTLSKAFGDLMKKNGYNIDQASALFNTASEAVRVSELIKAGKEFTSHMNQHEIDVGLMLHKQSPEVRKMLSIWDGMRINGIKTAVEGGLYTEEVANILFNSVGFVPFYRVEQIEKGKGPKEFVNSLRVESDKRFKGSEKEVNNILDNIIRWNQYIINRSVRAKSANTLATYAAEAGLAHEVFDAKGDNIVTVWDKGRERHFYMEDPLFVEAFTGLESVAIPLVDQMSKFTKLLRNSVVLYPVFSISQVPQDAFAAMFTSGLKPKFALKIPYLAVKSFIQTLRGKSSRSSQLLKSAGVTGLFDATSEAIRKEVESKYHLTKDAGLWDKTKIALGHWAAASDNAVRQATFEASIAQGLSEAEALEKSIQIFNPHSRGTSKTLALASRLIPFFNAYIAVQHVAYKTLTGRSTSPSDRQQALKTLLATTGSVFALSLMYSMLNGDDDDYLRKPTPTRDRLLMIPGSGGISIPIRNDIFSLPKIIAEHTYLLLSDNGYEDSAKFRSSMANALVQSFTSPTLVPQAVKPVVEALMNRDFYQGKPIINREQEKEETFRQFDSNTSEFSKVLGSSGAVSPLMADHFIRGFFGSAGGLFLYMTNPMIAAAIGKPRPEESVQDMVATLPGVGNFSMKSNESALRHDFYELRDATDKVAKTLADIKKNSPEDLADYLSDPDHLAKLNLNPRVTNISKKLTDIRNSIKQINNAPPERMSSDEKGAKIDALRKQEEAYLKGVNIKALREQAGL